LSGGSDRRRIDGGVGKLLLRRRRARHASDREPDYSRMQVRIGERAEDGFAETTFGPMIFDRHDPTGLASYGCKRVRIDRLDRVEVDDAGGDPVRL
jgi:hypothetical protein